MPAPSIPSASRTFTPPALSAETLALIVAAFLTLVANSVVWRQVFEDRSWSAPGTWLFALCLVVAVTALQFVFIALPLSRWTTKLWLSAVLLASAFAAHFIQTYNVYLDPPMLRGVLHTQPKEAGELLTGSLIPRLLWQAVLPIAVLWWLPLRRFSWRRAVIQRVATMLGALAVCILALLLVFQDAAALARNHREWRYQVTPANVLYSLVQVGRSDAGKANQPRKPIGLDAHLGPRAAQARKPTLLVLVVGETARAQNWGLSGYARQTTPELAKMDVLNFAQVSSCGTNTEVSLPCMFAPVGRRDYNEARIRRSQGLLHVLTTAGYKTLWRDNQTGCKGTCEGLPLDQLDSAKTPGLCEDGRCFDEILLDGLDKTLTDAQGNRVVVLHMLGSHGPAYDRRYPDAFRRFTPVCDTEELHRCTPEQIVNSYDNTLLYTDHVLAQTIRLLQRQQERYDTAMLYVSDHGESLGEYGLFLHGVPYAIAPEQQTRVPMVMWLSDGLKREEGLDVDCLKRRAAQPASHDNLFHTVLGLLDVQTSLYEPGLDITRDCGADLAR